jgi:hypothetical protein
MILMPGDQWKNQHTVQEAYLKAFCDPVPHEKTHAAVLWVHSANEVPARRVPKKCAVEPYFYCHDDNGQRSFLVEKELSYLESASGDMSSRLLDTATYQQRCVIATRSRAM